MPRAALLLATISLALSLGCGGVGVDPVPTGDLQLRFAAEDAAQLLEADTLYEHDLVAEWRADSGTHWSFRNLEPETGANGRLRLSPTGVDPQVVRTVDFDAGSIDRVEVLLAGLQRGTLELFWAAPGENFSLDRRVDMEGGLGRDVGDGLRSYRFDLVGHPRWRGRVSRLRVDPGSDTDEHTELAAVLGTKRRLSADALSSADARSWRIDLDNDARNGLLAPPATPIERRLTIPEGAVLRLGYGLQAATSGPVRFMVSMRTDDDTRQQLMTRTLDPRRGEAGRWFERSIDLSDVAGQVVTLRLETSTRTPLDPTRGLPVWATPTVFGGSRSVGPNVVLICLDTLRADGLSSYGNPLPTSPFLDSWSDSAAARFESAVAPAPWTLPSHVSIFSGLDAVRHGVNHYGAVPASLEMMAEVMRSAGYTTAAITGGGYLRPDFGFAQGFDHFVYWEDDDTEAELRANTSKALEFIDRHHSEPFFLFLHTYEPHYPHRRREPFFSRFAEREAVTPPKVPIQMRSHGWQGLLAPGDYFVVQRNASKDWVTPLTDDEKNLVRLMYASAVAYTDAHLKELFDRLDRYGLRDNTMIIVTSDHGEALGEEDRAGHAYLEDYNLLVPLMIGLPGGRGAGVVVSDQVRLVDLLPTIIDAAGVSWSGATDGVSLLPLLDGNADAVPPEAWAYASSSNKGVALRLDGEIKYRYGNAAWSEIAGRESLHDLVADPEETTDIAASDPRTPTLREKTRQTVLEQHRGYRLQISNRGRHTLRGRLQGAFASHDRVRSADDCGCVHWAAGRPATFELAPGTSTTLFFESLLRPRGGFSAEIVDGESARLPLEVDVELADITEPIAWELKGAGWTRAADAPDAPNTGFLLWREGSGGLAEAAGEDTDAIEQLRALGYVD